ncbi:DUF6804 family protein [Pseudozobellia thermophila]|uniref:Uncharacterized protein n=1 Tax=Pseudozobellia thermophila TaxID=192903 RepID=A0A1M6NMR4_9FLAO|nr:hypothetical protein SAMN04488513_11429 [Pseudozobellia thermophila]
MRAVFKKDIFSYVALLCVAFLLLSLLNWRSEYYTLLRTVVFIGAVLVALKESKVLFTFFCFALVAYLFNPFIPVYLYRKIIWIPIDLICALLFLLQAFQIRKRPKPYVPYAPKKRKAKSYGRDKKY